jgi:hypothetical protein
MGETGEVILNAPKNKAESYKGDIPPSIARMPDTLRDWAIFGWESPWRKRGEEPPLFKSDPETEKVAKDLTTRAVNALNNNSEIDRQILEKFKAKRQVTSNDHFDLKNEDGSVTKIKWGEMGESLTTFHYFPLIEWSTYRGEDIVETGMMGFREEEMRMDGGKIVRSHIEISRYAENKKIEEQSGVDNKTAHLGAEEFVKKLEEMATA